jgi:hypothetical protein
VTDSPAEMRARYLADLAKLAEPYRREQARLVAVLATFRARTSGNRAGGVSSESTPRRTSSGWGRPVLGF